MHWLTKWRREYVRKDGRKGIGRDELAKLVRNRDTGCSAVLIGIVEGGGVTHPEIAKRIAKVTGATVEQYNSMVHKIHHGGYIPNAPRKYSEFKTGPRMAQPLTPGLIPDNARAVVCIDPFGNEIGRHVSLMEAARAQGCSTGAVENRCHHRTSKNTNEFKLLERTFRFADEWDKLSREDQLSQLQFGNGH